MLEHKKARASASGHLRKPRKNALVDALRDAQGAVDPPPATRETNHEHARLVPEQPTDRVFVDLQSLRNVADC